MDKGEKIQIRVSKDWLAKLDEWRANQAVTPSRAEVIRSAVERLIAAEKKAKR